MSTLPHQPATPETLTERLTALHESYVEAINAAVAADDRTRVAELSRGFDREALDLMAESLHGRAA